MKLIYAAIVLVLAFSANATQVEIKDVSSAAQVQAQDRYSYDFGMVWVNTRTIRSFNLKNTGTTPMTFKEAVIYGGAFAANHSCTKGLLPNETCTFSIAFWPAFEGMYSGHFVLSFVEEDIVFNLWGQARRM